MPQDKKAIIADIVSFFHLLGAISYCITEEIQQLEVHTQKNLNNSHLTTEGILTSKKLKIQISHSKKNKSPFLIKFLKLTITRIFHKNKQSNIFLGHHTYFKPSLLKHTNTHNVQTFSFEEGIGTYGNMQHHVAAAKREKTRFPRTKYIIKQILKQKLWLDAKWEVISNPTSAQKRAFLLALDEASELTWENGSKLFPAEHKHIQHLAIFFSSPLVEMNLLSSIEYASLLQKIHEYFAKQDLRIVFKLHPLDKNADLLKDYGLPILETNEPAEIIINKCKPELIAGFNSGTLIIAKQIFNLKSISLNEFLPYHAKQALETTGSLKSLFNSTVETAYP